MLGTIDAVEEGEVHYGLQITVFLGEFAVFLPSCSIGRFGYPSLTYRIEVRIFVVQGLHPKCHSISVGIRISIHANAIDSNGLYPPLAVLNQVFHHMRVSLIQIWHWRHKPSIHGLMEICLAGVRIQDWSQLIVGLEIHIIDRAAAVHRTYLLLMLRSLILRHQPLWGIKPILWRHIRYPRMLETAMVENHVHHHLQALLVCLVYQLLILGIGTETRIHLIIIGSGITMISAILAIIRAVILQHWCKP